MVFITCESMGGLGNQLFIIFTTIASSIKQNIPFKILKLSHSPSITPRITYYDTLLKSVPTVDKITDIDNVYREHYHMNYQEFPQFVCNTKIEGYFQSRKYIDPIRHIILDMIKLSHYEDIINKNNILQDIRAKANGRKCVFLHIRRGDYLHLAHFHYNIPIDYYQQAVLKFPNCYFVIFSDDIPYCKEQLNFITETDKYYIDQSKDYIELILMSELDGAIIANSSFSWWGAYLCETKNELLANKSPLIIAPRIWFTGHYEQNDRIVPRHNWLII